MQELAKKLKTLRELNEKVEKTTEDLFENLAEWLKEKTEKNVLYLHLTWVKTSTFPPDGSETAEWTVDDLYLTDETGTQIELSDKEMSLISDIISELVIAGYIIPPLNPLVIA